ncbi:MAG: hypothetical protein ACO3XO_09780 [Bdellovibrionota bacterium]
MFQDPSHNARNRSDGPEKHGPEQRSLDLNDAYRHFLNTARKGVDRAASKPQFIKTTGLERNAKTGGKVINALKGHLEEYLPEELLETHQLRILNPHLQSVILDKKGEGNADVVRFSYMAMVELYQPEEPQSYALIASSEDGFFFDAPVAHFMHFLDRESRVRTGEPPKMNWSLQAALSPAALIETVAEFEDLQSSAITTFLGDFLRNALCDLLEYDDPSDSRIDERCQVTKLSNGNLEMHFDKKHIPEFSVYLHPQLLKLQCHFPPSLIAHVERTREH